MQKDIEQLIAEIEQYAATLGVSPSTIGERAGQGGRFYARLKAGKRAWPDTIARVRAYMASDKSRHKHNDPVESGIVSSLEINTGGAA